MYRFLLLFILIPSVAFGWGSVPVLSHLSQTGSGSGAGSTNLEVGVTDIGSQETTTLCGRSNLVTVPAGGITVSHGYFYGNTTDGGTDGTFTMTVWEDTDTTPTQYGTCSNTATIIDGSSPNWNETTWETPFELAAGTYRVQINFSETADVYYEDSVLDDSWFDDSGDGCESCNTFFSTSDSTKLSTFSVANYDVHDNAPLIDSQAYYVAMSATGDGSGSDTDNYMSLATHNATFFNPGDTIYISASDPPTNTLIPRSSGTSGSPITYDGYEAGDCDHSSGTLDTNGALISVGASNDGIVLDGNDYLTIQDFRIVTVDDAIYHLAASGKELSNVTIQRVGIDTCDNGIQLTTSNYAYSGGSYVTIQDCTIIDTAEGDTSSSKAAIRLYNHSDLVIKDNLIFNNETVILVTNGQDGIVSLRGLRVLIEGNTIYHVSEDGIDVKNDDGNTHGDYIIRYNHIYDTLQSALTLQHETGDQAYVYGNYFHGGTGDEIQGQTILVQRGFEEAAIWANVLRDGDKSGVLIYDQDAARPVDNAIITNNTIVANRQDDTAYQLSGVALWHSNGGDYWVKNNILVDNNTNDADLNQVYVSSEADGDTALDYNLYYDYAGTARIYWNAGYASPSTQDSNYILDNPDFTNWATRDLTLTADSPAVNSGTTISSNPAWWSVPTIQGVDYSTSVSLDLALDPNNTDWTTTPPTVTMVDQDSKGVGWERGAYVYDE